jgi:tetratricopeptide (TPR) repeat protein
VIAVFALFVLLAAGIYFPFRDKLLTPAQSAIGDRNLQSPEDKSADLVRQGESERAQRNYIGAEEQFHRALELQPNNPEIRFLLAQTHLFAGKTDDAMKGYREILRIAPEHLDARLQLAEVYRLRGNWTAAYKEYQNIIELNQNSMQAAAALEAIEKQQASVQQTEQIAKNALLRRKVAPRPIIPPLPGPAINAQVPPLSTGPSVAPDIKPPMAISSARPEDNPDPRIVADTHKRLGVRYLNIREYRAAINEFLRAVRLNPDDKDLYYFIGSSYHGLGLYADAYNYYRRVDGGPYLGPAQSGTKQTEKAAREAAKRRENLKFQSINSDPNNEADNNKSSKSFMNRVLDGLKQ